MARCRFCKAFVTWARDDFNKLWMMDGGLEAYELGDYEPESTRPRPMKKVSGIFFKHWFICGNRPWMKIKKPRQPKSKT